MQLINIFKFFQFNYTFEEIPDTSKQNKHKLKFCDVNGPNLYRVTK